MFHLHALYVNFREVKIILMDNLFEEKSDKIILLLYES